MMKLRYYQESFIDKIRIQLLNNFTKIVSQAPTGSGKTVIFSYIAKSANDRDKNVLIVTDRIELLYQASGSFDRIGLKTNLITANTLKIPFKGVTVGMIETIKRRVKQRLDFQIYLQRIDLLIIDECHKANFNDIFAYLKPKCIVLGFTATPIRVGKTPPLSEFYQTIVEGESISKLILDNYLSKPKYFGVPIDLSSVRVKAGEFNEVDLEAIYKQKIIFTGLKQNIEKHAKGMKTIIFCPTIETSKEVANELNCLHIDGTVGKNERKEILSSFENDTSGVISNVGILTTGYDCPDVECIILYRATKSLPLFLQMCGRGSRVTDSKKEFTILDFGNNCLRHGFWHQERKWSLENDKKKKKKGDKDDIYPIKDCPVCGCLVPVNIKTCEFCGHVWTQTEIEKRVIELQKMEYGDIIKNIKDAKTVKEMEDIRIARGYKVGWLLRQFVDVDQFEEYAKFKRYKNGWVKYQSKIYLEK